MNDNNRNMILAIVLSIVVLFGWQFLVAGPQMERANREAQLAAQQQAQTEQQVTDAAIAVPNADGTVSTPSTTAEPIGVRRSSSWRCACRWSA